MRSAPRLRAAVLVGCAAGLALAGCATAPASIPSGAEPPAAMQTGDAQPRLRPEPAAQNGPQRWIDGVCRTAPITTASPVFGALTFVRGYEMFALSSALGGLSGLEFGTDGALYAVTDAGVLVAIDVDAPQSSSEPSCRMIYMAAADGELLAGKARGDSEDLVRTPDGGLLVSFERAHRVSAFDLDAPQETVIYEFSEHGLENNQSLEALTLLRGELLVGAESPSVLGRAHPVWRLPLWTDENGAPVPPQAVGQPGAPRPPSLRIADANGYGLVGFAATPGDNLLTLHRFYSRRVGNRIQIGFIDGDALPLTPQIVDPAELFYLDRGSALPVDNFEGIATRARADGLIEIWIVSDDNFNGDQRQLLYAFTFDEAGFAEQVGQ